MIIYKLIIGKYYYIGHSKQKIKTRFTEHKYNCFKSTRTHYNQKVYCKIRELKITKTTFRKKVKIELICYACGKYPRKIEDYFIDLDDPYCLNQRKSGCYDWNEYMREYNKNGKNRDYKRMKYHLDKK